MTPPNLPAIDAALHPSGAWQIEPTGCLRFDAALNVWVIPVRKRPTVVEGDYEVRNETIRDY